MTTSNPPDSTGSSRPPASGEGGPGRGGREAPPRGSREADRPTRHPSAPHGPSDSLAPDLPALPRDDGGPIFKAPWEAQAFAMAVTLHEAGHFTWREWADRLAAEIARARERGDPDLGTTYYEHWLAALERLVAEKGLVGRDELARRTADWERAARATPHGRPIELPRA